MTDEKFSAGATNARVLRVVLYYALFGALWIFFSDELVDLLDLAPHLMTAVALVKGWIYVAVTSMLLFYLICRMLNDIHAAQQKLRISEERYQSIFDSVNDAIFIHDAATGAILDINQRAAEMFGYSREEARQIDVGDISSGIPPYTKEQARAWMAKAATGAPQLFAWQARHHSGHLFWVEVNMRQDLILDEERLVLTVRDITKHKMAEEQLQLQAMRLEEEIAKHRQTAEALRESEHQVRRKLDAILSPEADVAGLELSDIIDSEKIQKLMDKFYQLTNIGIGVIDLHGRVLVGTGWQEICTKFHRLNPESCRLCVESDTELSNNVPSGTFKRYRCKNNMWDMATPIMLGDQHVGNIFLGQFLFDDETLDHEVFRQQARRYGFDEREYLAALDRVPRWSLKTVDAAMSFYADFAEMLGALSYGNIKLANALEKRNLAEMALTESERRLRALFEGAPIGMTRTTLGGQLIQLNQAYAAMFGYATPEEMRKEVNPAGIAPLWLTPEIRAEFIKKVEDAQGHYVQQEITFHRKDGTLLDTNLYMMLTTDPDTGEPCLVGFIQDITERKKLTEQLQQSQKMESIGRLAGGVAHDFNNMLSVIMGSAELLKMETELDESAQRHLDHISRAALRSSQITRQLLAFSRKEVVSPRPVNLNALIAESEKMLSRLLREDITLTFKPADGLWRVKIDPSQLDQILMNLAVNARDAMPNGGHLVIETTNAEITGIYSQYKLDAHPGEYVHLTVSDTGVGMDRETQKHIFEPFFTTKGATEGTGLGLSTVYGIVTQNNGFISVYSEVGQGTVFNIYLPRLRQQAVTEEKSPPMAPSHTGTVLLVEDEEMLLQVATSLLKRLGYSVIEAATPHVAISICERENQQIDLILTDVVMPGMNGKEMVEQIKEKHPKINVLFMSGYPADIVAQRGVLEEGMHYIQKPLEMNALNEKIREIFSAC